MNIDEIIQNKKQLDEELKLALCTMEKKDTIFEIRKKIEINQNNCPHCSLKYNWEIQNNHCPYCGKNIEEARV